MRQKKLYCVFSWKRLKKLPKPQSHPTPPTTGHWGGDDSSTRGHGCYVGGNKTTIILHYLLLLLLNVIIIVNPSVQVGRVRGQLQQLLSYDWLSVPLVYTQTVGHNEWWWCWRSISCLCSTMALWYFGYSRKNTFSWENNIFEAIFPMFF